MMYIEIKPIRALAQYFILVFGKSDVYRKNGKNLTGWLF
jgi:hypothetical protein